MSRERDYGCAFFAAFPSGKPAENSQPFERYFGSLPMGSGTKSTNELPTGGSGRPRRCRLQRLLAGSFSHIFLPLISQILFRNTKIDYSFNSRLASAVNISDIMLVFAESQNPNSFLNSLKNLSPSNMMLHDLLSCEYSFSF